jgi:glycerol-3-phosphate dehydrogenase
MIEFSHRSRSNALSRFKSETFDILVVGGGITGAAVARDAASRGLKVALVEKRDFAWGTSSRSSKLVHGGLRYLENMEFKLVFEALSERANLLKTIPNMVRPLKFYFPVYKGDKNGKGIIGLGMWLYDILAIFRTPGIHKSLSKKKLLADIPFLKSEGLVGGFSYYDASMWDDALVMQILRSAEEMGAASANYVEALRPIYENDRIAGFVVRDRERPEGEKGNQGEITLKAHQVVMCTGPWTDLVGKQLSGGWHQWLMPSKGVHIVFDWKKLPIPGAAVMSHPEDGRIVFVIPRPDYGMGVTIVGTTDGPSPVKPEEVGIETADIQYLLQLLSKYFPDLKLTTKDIMSAYVGIRPLMAPHAADQTGASSESNSGGKPSLQKVSREHHIGEGPAGTVAVAGGKYTTHRTMAEEIVDYAVKIWERDHKLGKIAAALPHLKPSHTKRPINPMATPEQMLATYDRIPERELVERYGAEALEVSALACEKPDVKDAPISPPGFPLLAAQLRHTMKTEMVMHLEDFYLRRIPLYLAREDHGLPWAEELAQVWAEERGLGAADAARELEHLKAELDRRSSWRKGLLS